MHTIQQGGQAAKVGMNLSSFAQTTEHLPNKYFPFFAIAGTLRLPPGIKKVPVFYWNQTTTSFAYGKNGLKCKQRLKTSIAYSI
jgi:hypothetical protein